VSPDRSAVRREDDASRRRLANQTLGLGAGRWREYLPLGVQKSCGDWTTHGGARRGYWINHSGGTDDKNYGYFGWLLQRKITSKLLIGAELFHQTATTIGAKDSTGVQCRCDLRFRRTQSFAMSARKMRRYQSVLLVHRLSDRLVAVCTFRRLSIWPRWQCSAPKR
jgi:hypothetical protein